MPDARNGCGALSAGFTGSFPAIIPEITKFWVNIQADQGGHTVEEAEQGAGRSTIGKYRRGRFWAIGSL